MLYRPPHTPSSNHSSSGAAALRPLPLLLDEIAQVAGLEAALLVAREKGGTRAHFSSRPQADNWLAKLVGIDAARAIGQSQCAPGAASVHLNVPLGPLSPHIARWQLILDRVAQGHSNARIAMEFRVDYKTIQRIRSGKRKSIQQAVGDSARALDREPGLFD